MSRSIPRSVLTPRGSTYRSPWTRATSGADAAREGAAGRSSMSRPTINLASSRALVSLVARVAATLPFRRTVTVWLMFMTSFSLWLMKMTAVPRADRPRMISNNPSISWGIRTDVGSSRTRSIAPRYRVLRISTRCCSPTERSETRAAGFTFSLYCSERSWRLAETFLESGNGYPALRNPMQTFCATVRVGISMKC